MPAINLLPWRAELRKKRRNQFYMGLGGAVAGAGLVVLFGGLIMGWIIDNQKERNELLTQEIAELDQRIKEILDLEQSKQRLLARMEIIEQLQRSRPEIVHVFDQIVRTLPEGVYLTAVKQTGPQLEIKGAAESNTRVSALMRNIDKSGWLTEPDLQVVEVKPAKKTEPNAVRASEFTVIARQPSTREDEEAAK
jgi:type IV pilus assembly protein PilN